MTASAPRRYRHFTPLRIFIFVVVLLGYFGWQGSQKTPTGAAAGTALNGSGPASRPAGDTLRVATFNIDGKAEPATIDTIRGFDLIGLEEVHGTPTITSPLTSNNARSLGEALNMPWLFAPVERQWWHDAFGDGVLTDLPVEHWARLPIAGESADSNREVLVLRITLGDKSLSVLITHLERHDDREAELGTVISLFESMQTPAILMGDLNTDADDKQLVALRSSPGVSDPIGDLIAQKGGGSYDRIFVRGMRAYSAGWIDKGASDHPLAWAELEVNP